MDEAQLSSRFTNSFMHLLVFAIGTLELSELARVVVVSMVEVDAMKVVGVEARGGPTVMS